VGCNAKGAPLTALIHPAAVVKTHGGIKKSGHAKAARGIAEKDGSLSRRFEQTGVAFDVILN